MFCPHTPLTHFFFINHPIPPEIYTLSLHDALPIFKVRPSRPPRRCLFTIEPDCDVPPHHRKPEPGLMSQSGSIVNKQDRKSTRLNSSHVSISYAVFCLKKKKCSIICLYDTYIKTSS